MLIEKYFDLTLYGVDQDINKYLANGWRVKTQGLTLLILEKEV